MENSTGTMADMMVGTMADMMVGTMAGIIEDRHYGRSPG